MEQSQRTDDLLSQLTRQRKIQRIIAVLTSLAALSSAYSALLLQSTSSLAACALIVVVASPQWGIYYATTHSIEILNRLKPIVDDLEKKRGN